jgi:hypothetical protein
MRRSGRSGRSGRRGAAKQAAAEKREQERRRVEMADIVFIVLSVGFFVLGLWYIRFCDKV